MYNRNLINDNIWYLKAFLSILSNESQYTWEFSDDTDLIHLALAIARLAGLIPYHKCIAA